ncbi:MAG: hypothetical protein J2P37_34640, partial [Ktedonobacteraceae bacterium]|nr:hypothetical protein [Ktedonobacteraceae bacterium]
PEPHLKQSPLLCLAYAATLIFARDQQPPDAATARRIEGMMEEMLQVAEEGWRARDDLARLGEVYALRAFLTFQQGKRDQAVSYAGQALTWLPKKNAMWRGLTLSTLGIDALLAGQLNEARPLFQEVASLWEVAGNEHALNGVRFMLGVICLEQGEIHQAARHYRKLNQAGLNDMSIMAHLGQIQIYYEWNDLEALRQQAHEIERLVDQITEIPTAILHLLIEMVQARLDHTQGETERAIQRLTDALSHLPPYLEESFFFYQEALAWLIRHSLSLGDIATAQHWFNKLVGHHDRARPIPGTLALAAPAETQTPEPDEPGELAPIQNRIETSPVFQEQKALLMARIFLAQREADDALTTLSYVLPAAQAAGRERNVLQIKLLMAQACAARTQLPEARQLLIEALEQGYPQGFQRLFLDEGEGLFPLLRDLLPHLPGQPLHGYVRLLLQAFAQTQASQPIIVTPIAVPLIEPLSAQEQRVLRLLVAGRSNPEIALELVVSVNTIRTQVQSIYRKLNVHNRNAASEVARQLQLV